MKQKKQYFLTATSIALMAAVVALSGCGKKSKEENESAAKGKEIVTIGMVGPLTGPSAIYGQDNERGARLAVDELNQKDLSIGGKKVFFKLDAQDDGTDPKQATTVAQMLVDAKVAGVIGHYNSGTSIVAAPIYAKAGIPQITPSASSPTFTKLGYKTVFRVAADDVRAADVLAAYAVNTLKIKKIAVIDDRTDFGQGFANEFVTAAKKLGATILSHDYTTNIATDFSAILTSIKAEKPQMVFLGALDQTAGPLMRQMASLGMDAKLAAGMGVCTPQFLKLAGSATGNDQVFCAEAHGVDASNQVAMDKFNADFVKKYGSSPVLYAPNSYDAVNLMVSSMEKANSVEPEKYLPVLAKTKDYQGITASITFDAFGNMERAPITLQTIRQGAFVPIKVVR